MIHSSRSPSSVAAVQNTPRHSQVLGQTKKTSSGACAPLCHANSILRYFGIINWVDGVNWSPLKFSKLTFRALALPQSEMFLRHSLWRRVNALNVSFKNLNGHQFTLSPFYTLPSTQHHSFFKTSPLYSLYFILPCHARFLMTINVL